jgi:predicted metal-dependent HD superfamily phosphohydrolase
MTIAGDLQKQWLRLLAALEVDSEEGRDVFGTVVEWYSSPGRVYHTLEHIGAVLDALVRLGATPERDPALLLAAWFHDAVYDSRAADNEEQSARLAERVLHGLGVQQAVVEETARLILLTKTHVAAAEDGAGRRLLDADLAVLGESEQVYREYARGIRREYAWVPEEDYRAGRSKVLGTFLGRPAIYATELFRAEREAAARGNLRQEMAELSRPRAE